MMEHPQSVNKWAVRILLECILVFYINFIFTASSIIRHGIFLATIPILDFVTIH